MPFFESRSQPIVAPVPFERRTVARKIEGVADSTERSAFDVPVGLATGLANRMGLSGCCVDQPFTTRNR